MQLKGIAQGSLDQSKIAYKNECPESNDNKVTALFKPLYVCYQQDLLGLIGPQVLNQVLIRLQVLNLFQDKRTHDLAYKGTYMQYKCIFQDQLTDRQSDGYEGSQGGYTSNNKERQAYTKEKFLPASIY